jgi:hypothetical protein
MPEPIRKSENELTWQQILDLMARPGSDETAEIRNQEQPVRVAKTPTRELVLRVIDGLKRA